MVTTNRRDTQTETLKKAGVRSKAQAQRDANFVGSRAAVTFSEQSNRMLARFTPGDTEVAELGEFYDSGVYRQTEGSEEKTYENIFERLDWEVAAQDPNTKLALDEVFGNNDKDPSGSGGEVTQAELREVLGTGTTEIVSRSLKERSVELTETQNSLTSARDEDTRGIRGVDDVDAPIDPIA